MRGPYFYLQNIYIRLIFDHFKTMFGYSFIKPYLWPVQYKCRHLHDVSRSLSKRRPTSQHCLIDYRYCPGAVSTVLRFSASILNCLHFFFILSPLQWLSAINGFHGSSIIPIPQKYGNCALRIQGASWEFVR